MLKSLLLPQGEKKNRTACFPHPPKPCLQSCHPVADRLSGVAARRGRRFGGWDDVHHSFEGPCGNWSPSGDKGEAAGLSDRSCRLPAQQGAGCACAARKEAGEHRVASAGLSPVRAAQVAATSLSTIPAFAERSKSQAKTAERGAGRCHIKLLQTRHHRRPVRPAHDAPTGQARSGWPSWKQVL